MQYDLFYCGVPTNNSSSHVQSFTAYFYLLKPSLSMQKGIIIIGLVFIPENQLLHPKGGIKVDGEKACDLRFVAGLGSFS